MGFWSRLFGAHGPPAASETVREASGANTDPRVEEGFRKLGGTDRDLNPVTQQRMRDLAHALWDGTPLGKFIIEAPLSFILAEGVRLRADGGDDGDREQVQEWLDLFWYDPITDMPLTLTKRARELAMFGEQVWTIREAVDGHIRLGYLDPGLIEEVIVDPSNTAVPIGINTVSDGAGRKHSLRIVYAGDELDLFDQQTVDLRSRFKDGECFYFRCNDLMGGARGRSDLLPSSDWIDALDQFLFGELERADYMRSWIWDITINGATQEEVNKRASETQPPRTAGMRFHNEGEIWETKSPDIRAEDGDRAARLFRNHALGASGIPEHWVGGGGNVNRATAAEMGVVTFKMLTMRQQLLKAILERVGTEAVRRRRKASGRAGTSQVTVVAEFPELVTADVTKYATALAQVTAAVSNAVSAGLLAEPDAVRLIAAMAAYLGVEIDPEEALEKAKEERKAKAEGDVIGETPDDDGDG